MNAAPAPARAFILALGLVALAASSSTACDSSSPKPDAKGKPAETKAADTKAGGAEAEAKAADTKQADSTPTEAKAADTKQADSSPTETAAGTEPKKHRRGLMPPEGMRPDEIKKFATDTGDPTGGEFTLAQAFEGDPTLADRKNGKLVASFDTTMGAFECELYEDRAPLTVANFVGLARGVRPTYDKKTDAWVTKKYYDGVIFHRVIKGFMIQTGDDTNTGRGNPGYVIVDEFAKGLRHDAAGVLSMANREKPNTGSTQFFITVRATKHLDGKHTVFGKCADATVPIEISKVKVDARAGDRPYEQVKINTITISRKNEKK